MSEGGEDRALAAAYLASRDEDSFRALYRRHADFLYRFLLRLAGDPAEAEEGVQETWVRAARALSGFQWRSTLRTWLAGIAVRWWKERSRMRGRLVAIPGEDELPAALPIRREVARIDLERALAALPPGYREAVLLHDVEGYTHEEIGKMKGVEAGTSKSQLSRARRALRARLIGRAS